MENTSKKSRAVALVLALFLGAWGGHRFYTGKKNRVTMLILSLTVVGMFITVPWAWVDIIKILAGSFTDRDGLLVKNW